MTEMAAGQLPASVAGRVSAWIARLQQQFSDYLHADGDALARERGWTITTTTGRFGFGGRVYRDPRFDQLAAAARLASRMQPTPGGRDDHAPHLDRVRPPSPPLLDEFHDSTEEPEHARGPGARGDWPVGGGLDAGATTC